MAQKRFIGGLAFSTSTERLREVFAAAGQVESAAVVTDHDTGRSRGFGGRDSRGFGGSSRGGRW